MAGPEHFDLVIVGAGLSALTTAQTYLHCAPTTRLLILDSQPSLGGVWSSARIYPGLKSNNYRGTLEFPDFEFDDERGVGWYEHLSGDAMNGYLRDFAERYGLLERMRFCWEVREVERITEDGKVEGKGWRLVVVEREGEEGEDDGDKRKKERTSIIMTDKLIIATGLHHKPLPVKIAGADDFCAPILRAGQLGTETAAAILHDHPEIQHVTVSGGSKYAFDSVYKFAAAGKQIDWVISKSGHGPTFIIHNMTTIPLLGRIWAERLVTLRFISWLSPCIFGGLDGSAWWRWCLHSTRLGRRVVAAFWAAVSRDVLEQAGYFSHPSLRGLVPDCEWFDTATSFGTLNYPTDILEFVRSGQVRVHREDISCLSDHKVNLVDGTSLRSDAFVASSGWQWTPTVKFKPESLHASLGVASSEYSDEQKAFWAGLDARADGEIFSRFPMLRTRPCPPRSDLDTGAFAGEKNDLGKDVDHQPPRLFRLIAPPVLAAQGDRTLAFAGAGANITHTIKSAIAGIWIYAFFNDKLTIDPQRDLGEAQVCYESALLQRWSFRRHTYGFGQRFVDFVWDAIPWNDVLLRDLGLDGRRKKGSWFGIRWWKEAFEPYTVADYRGLCEEWLAKREVKDKRA